MKALIQFACLFILITLSSQTLLAQNTLTLRPDAASGKDAYIRDLSPYTNYGSHTDYSAHSWTNGGIPVTCRSLLEFDLSSIPSGSIITTAKLSLYHSYNSSNSGHSSQSGSNEAVLQRITQNWDEQTVTWNNQPSTTNINEVTLGQSTSNNQDYLDIDVTGLVQDMIYDTSNTGGFLLKLKTESHYRSMKFASSDNIDSNLHPMLVVSYTLTTGLNNVDKEKANFQIAPNPANGQFVQINMDQFLGEKTIQLINTIGELVYETTTSVEAYQLNIQNLSSGIYFVRTSTKNQLVTKKLIIK